MSEQLSKTQTLLMIPGIMSEVKERLTDLEKHHSEIKEKIILIQERQAQKADAIDRIEANMEKWKHDTETKREAIDLRVQVIEKQGENSKGKLAGIGIGASLVGGGIAAFLNKIFGGLHQ